jgi:hypothetical protein
VEAATEAIDPFRDDDSAEVEPLQLSAGTAVADRPLARGRDRSRRSVPVPWGWLTRRWHAVPAAIRREYLWVCVVYLSARAVLIIAAVLLDAFGHKNLQGELANWDGLWYREVANVGYPRHVYDYQTTLGFFPLFPVSIYLVAPVVQVLSGQGHIWASTVAGVLVSGTGGLVATVFVYKLAVGWWDRETARRAVAIFTWFAGGVVFSMVYSEGLLLPLAAVCIWALERRKWMLAGVMAGLGTAVQPVSLLLAVVVGVCALRELWLHGPRSREFRRGVLATAMSGIGAAGFALFLWIWTGSPFANYIAQHKGWGEKTDALALVHLTTRMWREINPTHFNHPQVNLNLVVGFLGALLMLWELVLLWKFRRELTLPAIVWTLGVTFFAATSEYVPPNPRMVITAFPMLMLLARRIRGKWFPVVISLNFVLFVVLSLLTFYEHVLRP